MTDRESIRKILGAHQEGKITKEEADHVLQHDHGIPFEQAKNIARTLEERKEDGEHDEKRKRNTLLIAIAVFGILCLGIYAVMDPTISGYAVVNNTSAILG